MSATSRITVLLVDDHDLIRQGLARAFERTHDFTVVGQAGSVLEARQLAENLMPQVIVTDVRLPDGSGLDVVRHLRKRWPAMGVVVLTMYAGDEQLFAAMEAGASAFVAKDVPADEVVEAARRATVSPNSFTAQALADALRRKLSPTEPRLSTRELEVLELLADGCGVTQVAGHLFVSESTAKTHISKIYEKLGAANRAQAIMKAVRTGLLSDGSNDSPQYSRK